MAKFLITSEYCGEEGKTIDAYDHQSAAEKYAEWEDSQTAEYLFAGGGEEIITVTDDRGNVSKRFRVSGETVPSYYATEVSDE